MDKYDMNGAPVCHRSVQLFEGSEKLITCLGVREDGLGMAVGLANGDG